MKKVLFFQLMLLLTTLLHSQTIVFHENFDSSGNNADSVTASGATNNFAINSRLFVSGDHCDSNLVTPFGTAYLTTNQFSTLGSPFVFLSFDHICKIELNDGGEIEISVNFAPWIKLTSTEYIDPGNSQFSTFGNKFSSVTYPLDWFPAQNSLKPTQSWWRHETFDLSSIAGNVGNVRIRFALRDGNGTGAFFNHGWYIDNIKVTGALSELTPPIVHLQTPVLQDTIYDTGPFDITAFIRDASGIDTAYLTYKVNTTGANIYIPMTFISDSTYKCTIPSYSYTNRIDYTVTAIDNSSSHNATNTSPHWFYIKKPLGTVVVGTGTSTSNLLPVNGSNNYSWGSMVYKVGELNFHGIIDSIAFYVTNTMSNYVMLSQKVFIGHTNTTTYGTIQPDTTAPNMTRVFSGDLTFTGPGWYRIKLDTTFTYNGYNNLGIYWMNKDGATVTGYPVFKYTATASNSCAHKASNTYNQVFPTSLGTETTNRPNLRIAYQPQALVNDAGIKQITYPIDTLVGSVPLPIKVMIKNFGSDTLRNVTVKWSLDGVYKDSINWSGTSAEGVVTLPFAIDTSTFLSGPHTIRAWTVKPNGVTDQNPANDLALVSFYSCSSILNGTYSIGPGGNFTSITAALTAMGTCGISGPVVFNIASGTYTGALEILPIPGASAINTVTFQSATGNNTDVIIQYAATGTSDNYVLRLKGADFMQFKNITFKSTSTTAYARVIELINGAEHNKFEGNIIQSIVTTTASTNTSAVYSYTSASDNFNVFLNNKIRNGCYGVYFYGSSSITKKGNQFIGNEITGWYNYGIYLYYNDSVEIVKNLVQNGAAPATSYYHIYSSYNNYGCKILKNKIQGTGTGTFYGIELYNPLSGASKPNLIANNFISQSAVSGTAYGIYLYAANFTNVYYNSVNITGTSTTGRALYVTSGSTGINIVNNILSNTGGGYTIYASTTTPINICDYNDLYATGTALGYWGANQTDLAAWRIASSKDVSSVSADPQFLSLTNLHTYSINILFKGIPLTSVTDDIDDENRSLIATSIGADETARLDFDLALESIISPVSSCLLTAAENVTVKIKNVGLNPMSNINVYYRIGNGTLVHDSIVGTIDTSASIIYTFTTPANLNAFGNYSIKAYLAHPLDQSTINDTLKSTITGSFNLNAGPYTQGFEPTEDFSNWSIINTNGGTYKWIIPYNNTTYSHGGSNSAQFYNGTANAGEDWLFSRCFNLEQGKSYSLSFWYRSYSSTYPQTITLKYGNAPNISAMTTTLTTLAGFTNTIHEQSVTQFVAPSTGSYYFGWSGTVGNLYYAYIDDINLNILPDQEAALDEIISPSTGCGLSANDSITLRIKNNGVDTISGNLTAYYKLNGNTPVPVNVNGQILPGNTMLFTFPTTENLSVTTSDVLFPIKAWVSLLNDDIHTNDTLNKLVISRHYPAAPAVVDDTVTFGQSALLKASSPDNIYWYANSTTPISFQQGTSYTTPILFDTVTYYVGASSDIPGFNKQVGTGTTVSTSTTSIPTNGYYNYSWSSCLYKSAELGFTGMIDTIAYYCTNSISNTQANVMNDQRIYMKNVSYNTLPDNSNPVITSMNKVFQGSINWSGGAGWKKIALTTPFYYNGTSNLELAWENRDGSSVTSPNYPTFQLHTVPANLVKYQYLNANFPTGAGVTPSPTIRPNTKFISSGLPGCPGTRVPVTAYVIIPPNEISVAEIIAPINSCTFGTEIVKAKFTNNGTDTINIPFTAGYYISGNPIPVIEAVHDTILPGHSIIYTFSTQANMPVPSGNVTYTVKVFANVSTDPYHNNDTLSKTVTLSFSPPDPVCTGATVSYPASATLNATTPVNWFSVPTGGSVIGTGLDYHTPTLYGNTTYYAEANTTQPGFINQVGTGSTSSYNIPTNGLYDYSWSSSLYLYTDLNFIGLIDTIMFYTNNSISSFQMMDQRIYMKLVSGSTLANVNNPVVANMTQVFQGNINWSGPGWFKIGLTTPFYYNGSSNLELAWENRDGSNDAGCPVFQGSTVPANMVKYNYQNASFPTGAGNWLTTRANTKFVISGTGCPSHRVPVSVTVTNQPSVDAGLSAFYEPLSPASLGPKDIKVVLRNFGTNTLNSVDISLKVNGIVQTPVYHWTGPLANNESDTVTIKNYNFTYLPYPALNELIAWTENPNGITDPTPANDTITTVIDAHDPMNGVYLIRTSTPDFNSFGEALIPLSAWGVNGPVTFVADTGTYNEHISIPPIPGASALNTITFQSITGINTDVILNYDAAISANNYVVQLNGADYVRFKNITISTVSTSNFGKVVEFKNGSTNNIFEGNIIKGLQTTTNNSSGIYCTDVSSNHNLIFGNELMNGYYGAYIFGDPISKIKGFKFRNNNISNYFNSGLYLFYNDSIQVTGNLLTSNSASVTNYAIYSDYCDNNSRFEKNKLTYNGYGTFYGLYLGHCNTTSTLPNWVVNNFISNTGSSGAAYGIYSAENNYLNIFYNSVNIAAGNGASTRAFHQTGGISNVKLKNNNFANTIGGYTLYVNTPAAINVSDNNNLYTNGTILAFWSSDRYNLAALQTLSGKDVHSRSITPNFFSVDDLHTFQIGLMGSGSPIAGITTDIDGDTRNLLTPCIGADESNPQPLDAGIVMINSPVNPAIAGPQPIKVTLGNFGMDTIHNVMIKFSVNGNLPTTVPWNGSLSSFDTIMNLDIGSVTLTAGINVIRAWTSMPNGVMDAVNINDTSSTSIIVCSGPIAGTFTIGGSNPDFYTFHNAIEALSICGIGGPVVFNVADGIYNERINLQFIPGMSASNTLTFQSASGNNNNVILQAFSSSASENYVLQLNGAKYTRFRNMTIRSANIPAISTYGRVVTLTNDADHNTFEGNKIHSINVSIANAAAIYSNSGNIDYNKFIGNEIKGGYHGIYFYGSTPNLNKGNEFRNNSITDWYYYGLYAYNNDSIIVTGNTTRNGANTLTGYHIYSYNGDNGSRYEKNQIYGNNTGTFYGLAILYNDGTIAEPIIVANNMISGINGTGTEYGLYLSYCTYANLYYNSVNIKGGSSTGGRSLYTAYGSNITLENNNLVNSGLGYAYYIQTTSAIVLSDYNNIFSSGSVFAYWGNAVSNLTALQTLSSKDGLSVSNDPIFVSTTNLHASSVGINGKAHPIPGFTDDIDGDSRNASTPDIGADEFVPLNKDIAVVAFLQPSSISAPVGSSKIIKVKVRNFGSSTINTFTLGYKYDGQAPVTGTWNGVLLPNQIDSFAFSLPISTVVGTNTLCAYTTLTGDMNISNDTTCMIFTGVPVLVVPFSDDMEGINYYYTSGTNSSWEYGTPASTTIDSAHSPTHAWKTNLDGYYNPNELSYLYTPFYNFGMVNNATLDFWHYYSTEVNNDGGHIRYSLNGGSTWLALGFYPNDPNGTNWYNSFISGVASWTGNSSGWVHSTYNLASVPAIVNATSPVQFRFEFKSDADVVTTDGWAIDDISITAPALSKDAGVIAILQPNGPNQTGSPVTVQVTIQNFGTDTLLAVPIRYVINGGPPSPIETWHNGVLNPGAFDNYTFNTTFVAPGTAYDLCAFTKRAGDTYWNNDTTCGHFGVTPPPHDVGVTTILIPVDGIYPVDTNQVNSQSQVKINIKNFGSTVETSIPVSFSVNTATVGNETWNGNLQPGDSVDYTFTTHFTIPLGNYQLCAKTSLTGDFYTTNDKTCHNYFGFNVGIDTYEYSSWDLLQNIPNPADNSTLIGFEIPTDGSVRIEMVDLLGNKVYVDEKEYSAGQNQIELDLRSIPAGIYFYSATYKNMLRTKRMVITK